MPGVSVQFHMFFDELVEFVSEVCLHYEMDVELESFFPKTIQVVPFQADMAEEIHNFGPVDAFWLLYTTPRRKKAEKFYLYVGGQKGNRLAQSHLGAGTDKADAFAILKKVAANLRHRTQPGMWVISAKGAVGYYKSERFSQGVAEAARTGKIELIVSGTKLIYKVDPPESGSSV